MITPILDTAQQTLTLKVDRDLLSSNSDEASLAFEAALHQSTPPEFFIIDLTACKMVDSVGLNLLFGVLHRSQELGAKPSIIIAKGPLERIFQVTQIGKIFDVKIQS